MTIPIMICFQSMRFKISQMKLSMGIEGLGLAIKRKS